MIRTIIIDDEDQAISALRQEINFHCKELIELVGYANDFENGVKLIDDLKPDLIFLDIQLGSRLGFDILSIVNFKDFEVVFTTAYSQYAIKAIKFSALDYLLKPIDYKELIDVTNRLVKKNNEKNEINKKISFLTSQLSKKKEFDQIALSTSEGTFIFYLNNIIFFESNGNYVNIYFDNRKRITVSKTLKIMQEMLDENEFVRIHHSFMVNLSHLIKYDSKLHTIITTGNISLPVSIRKSANLLHKIKNLNK